MMPANGVAPIEDVAAEVGVGDEWRWVEEFEGAEWASSEVEWAPEEWGLGVGEVEEGSEEAGVLRGSGGEGWAVGAGNSWGAISGRWRC